MPKKFYDAYEGNAVQSWMTRVGRKPLLKAHEEIDLAQLCQSGDGSAAERLAEANYRLVVSVAKRFRGLGVPFEDLIQEGNIGLLRAVVKFDPTRGVRFSTYATPWIYQAVTRAVVNQGRSIRLPNNVARLTLKVSHVAQILRQELGREPTNEEIADASGMPTELVQELATLATQTVSLDAPLGDDTDEVLGDLLADTLGTPAPEHGEEQKQETVEDMLQRLDPREREIVRLRFGLDGGGERTLADVGKRVHLSKERIRQIEHHALQKLRHQAVGTP
jgi:RNA polymerase primary sigma factor